MRYSGGESVGLPRQICGAIEMYILFSIHIYHMVFFNTEWYFSWQIRSVTHTLLIRNAP